MCNAFLVVLLEYRVMISMVKPQGWPSLVVPSNILVNGIVFKTKIISRV
jgi:hypothetical protein